VRGAFADMFGLPDGNIIAEFPMRGLVARERQRVENHPFVSIDKDIAYPGGKIVKSGSGFTLNGEVIIFSSSPSGENKSVAVFADQSGQFNYSYIIQPSAEAGVYQYWAEDKTTRFVADRVRYLIVSVAQKDIAPEKVTDILTDAAKEDDRESPSLALPKECSFSGAGTATGTKRIILNEVAWMGSTENHSNEWIELKNISSYEIDISGWWLIDQREQIKVVLPQNTIILAGRFFLLERTDDDSVLDVRADMVYRGILSNDEEGLRLLSPDCLIKDEVLADPKWSAGEASSRKTMERKADLSGWQTSVFINGTPKQRNSSGEAISPISGVATISAITATNSETLESRASNNTRTEGAGAGGSQASAPAPPTLCLQDNLATPLKTVLLNEIAWAGDDRSSANEWIELYNPGEIAVPLAGWQLLDKAEYIDIVFDSTDSISAGGYFLVMRGTENFIPGIQADKFYRNAINNSDETLRLFNNKCALVDEVIAVPDWRDIGGDVAPDYRTAERTLNGWQTFAGTVGLIMGTPRAKNSKDSSAQATTSIQGDATTSPVMSSQQCSFFARGATTSAKRVIINEVAWMGSTEHHANEWIELKNISSSEIDISGWWLIDQGEQRRGQVTIVFPQNTRISASGLFLLERTDDNSVPNVSADMTYRGILSNDEEGLRLLNSSCFIEDEVLAAPKWPAGEADSRKTMERKADLSGWQTSAVVNGTPKQRNSMMRATETTINNPTGNVSIAGTILTPSLESSPAQLPEILISEIRLLPIPQRFIELYNPNSNDIDLTDWYIQRRTATGSDFNSFVSKTHFANRIIPAKSFLVIAHKSIIQADIILPELTLTDSNTIQLKNASGTIVDKVGWGDTLSFRGINPASNPSQQQSIQRRIINGVFVNTNNNIEDFELQNCPSPKSYFGNCPAAIAAIRIIEVIFDPAGSDRGKERVILKNPNNLAIDLSGYSIQYLSQNNNFSGIKKRNFETGNSIPGEGIFKIGMNCSGDIPCEEVDLSWSRALNNQGGTLFLVSHRNKIDSFDDEGIINIFKYPVVTYLLKMNNFTA